MGIDTPAFSRGVERPSDTAAERGRLFNVSANVFLSPSSTDVNTAHTNTTDSTQFLLLANVFQVTSATVSAQTPVELGFRVIERPSNERFVLTVSDETIVESLPQLPVRPGDDIDVTGTNESANNTLVAGNFSLRQG
jgi:hypothetical protein